MSDKSQIVSYKVAQLIAQKTKSHSVAESIILLSREIVKITFCDELSNEILKVSLSNHTVWRRINDFSEYRRKCKYKSYKYRF